MGFGMSETIFDFSFGSMFNLFNVGFCIIFLVVICSFIVIFVKGIQQWNHNNHSPRLTVNASVVSKRTNVSHHHHHHHDTGMAYHTSTTYYVTFQVESGDRIEFHVSGNEYGMLVEGDSGKLTFQGTRYLEFVR